MASTTEEIHTDIIAGYTHFRKVGKSMCLTVPKGVRAALNWSEGQALFIYAADNHVVIQSLVEHMSESITKYDKQVTTGR